MMELVVRSLANILVAATGGLVVSTGTDEDAQLPYWQVADRSASIRLVQRLPDQTRGFFLARGFSAAQVERIAQSCVFQTVFRNTSRDGSPSALAYNLREWVVSSDGKPAGMKTREDWKAEWQALSAPEGAQIAFEWALLPTRQVYQPGDYNWGMSIFTLKPGAVFDLDLVWHQHGETRRARIAGIRCAPDVDAGRRG
jgi:hypothetical protein